MLIAPLFPFEILFAGSYLEMAFDNTKVNGRIAHAVGKRKGFLGFHFVSVVQNKAEQLLIDSSRRKQCRFYALDEPRWVMAFDFRLLTFDSFILTNIGDGLFCGCCTPWLAP